MLVNPDTLREIKRRAKLQIMKTSAYGSLILNNWFRKFGSQTPIESELVEPKNLVKKEILDRKEKISLVAIKLKLQNFLKTRCMVVPIELCNYI